MNWFVFIYSSFTIFTLIYLIIFLNWLRFHLCPKIRPVNSNDSWVYEMNVKSWNVIPCKAIIPTHYLCYLCVPLTNISYLPALPWTEIWELKYSITNVLSPLMFPVSFALIRQIQGYLIHRYPKWWDHQRELYPLSFSSHLPDKLVHPSIFNFYDLILDVPIEFESIIKYCFMIKFEIFFFLWRVLNFYLHHMYV